MNIEQNTSPDSPTSFDSVDIQSDDENDREVVEKRQSRFYPDTPVGNLAVVRPQFSCPDFSVGTARGLKSRLKDAPPVPVIPTVHVDHAENKQVSDQTSPSPRRVRKQNSFMQLDNSVKRRWEDSFEEESPVARKRHGLFLGRLQYYILEL